jgi:hypothetical protein
MTRGSVECGRRKGDLGDGTGSLGGGRLFLSDDALTIQAEPPAVDPFDIPFFAATVTARNFRVPHLCPLILIWSERLCLAIRGGKAAGGGMWKVKGRLGVGRVGETTAKTRAQFLRDAFEGVKGRQPMSDDELNQWLATDEGKAATMFDDTTLSPWGEQGRS